MEKREVENAPRGAALERGARAGTAPSGADASPSASPARGFAALLLVLGATALMNGSIFPQFDAVFMFARDISVTCSAITLLTLGLMA